MELGAGAYGFGLIAGVLTTLSPCVLPILPVLLGSASSEHPRAQLALAAGLAISYAIIGTSLAWMSANIGIDPYLFRNIGAVALGIMGGVLFSASLQQYFATATAGVGNAGNNFLNRLNPTGIRGQFITGLVLGVIWSPCVGPTLGGAIVMASQGTQLLQVMLLMGLFGAGAALPVGLLSFLSMAAILRFRGKMLRAGRAGKIILGALMILIAILILTGADKFIESGLLQITPAWLTHLTTRF